MTSVSNQLRLYADGDSAERPALPPKRSPLELANRELLRPASYRRGHHRLEPFSTAWLDELERKRYARHGIWLNAALEFGRHPGESILLINPGLGCDAIRFLHSGSEVTLALTENDDAKPIRANLDRHGLTAPMVSLQGPSLPFADGAFDVVVMNGLYAGLDLPMLAEELFRILKCGGKAIGLLPAYFDAGYWQDLILPYQRLYWRRPPDPTVAPKRTARQLRASFARFSEHKVFKRQLRRSELPHLFRVLPLVVLERVFGRVLVMKAKKPISAARIVHSISAAEPLAA